MAEFVAFNKEVEVNGNTVLSFVNSSRRGREVRLQILKKYGIEDIRDGDFFLQQTWLDAFKEVAEEIGDLNLFKIGTAIIENAEFPPLEDLQQALGAIDIAYHMNHRLDGQVMFNPQTGEKMEGIGHYNLIEFDAENRKAVMVCNNPYPSKFDEGIISEIVKRFKPAGSTHYEVKLDVTKERRSKGGDSCTYSITW